MPWPPVPPEVLARLRKASSVLVAGHSQPDGDCLYSCLALGRILASMGKEAVLVNEGPFLSSETRPLASLFLPEAPASFIARRPLVVIADCSSRGRVGAPLAPLGGLGLETVVLDHHSSHEDDAGAAVYRVPGSISTTLIVLHVAEALGVPLDEETARCIFRGFLTDSGCFRYLDASQNGTYKTIWELAARFGLSTSREMEALTSHDSPQSNTCLCRLLERTVFLFGGRLAVSRRTAADLEEFPLIDVPSGEFYRRTFAVEGVEAIVLLKATASGATEVGLRSTHRSALDVGAVAARLGGGGHAHAAGATLRATLDEAQKALESAIGALLERR